MIFGLTQQWNITTSFSPTCDRSEAEERMRGEVYFAIGAINSHDVTRMRAHITFFVPNLLEHDAEELDDLVRHELSHIPTSIAQLIKGAGTEISTQMVANIAGRAFNATKNKWHKDYPKWPKLATVNVEEGNSN